MRVLLLSSLILGIMWEVNPSPAPKVDFTLLDELEHNTNTGEENLGSTDTFEGDMILSKAQNETIEALIAQQNETEKGETRQKRKHYYVAHLWPKGILIYEPLSVGDFRSDTTKQGIIHQAINHIKERTCIKFQEATSGDRVQFVRGQGCSSPLGKSIRHGVHKITLADGCFIKLGTVVHEIMHSLGFMHEQSRPDRDNYVTIKTANIKPGYEDNFKKYSTAESRLYNIPYDVKSVMHYNSTAFSIDRNTKKTIEAKDHNLEKFMGQRVKMSPEDAQVIKLTYQCKGVGPSSTSGITHGRPCIDSPTVKPTCPELANNCWQDDVKKYCPVMCKVCKPTHYY